MENQTGYSKASKTLVRGRICYHALVCKETECKCWRQKPSSWAFLQMLEWRRVLLAEPETSADRFSDKDLGLWERLENQTIKKDCYHFPQKIKPSWIIIKPRRLEIQPQSAYTLVLWFTNLIHSMTLGKMATFLFLVGDGRSHVGHPNGGFTKRSEILPSASVCELNGS